MNTILDFPICTVSLTHRRQLLFHCIKLFYCQLHIGEAVSPPPPRYRVPHSISAFNFITIRDQPSYERRRRRPGAALWAHARHKCEFPRHLKLIVWDRFPKSDGAMQTSPGYCIGSRVAVVKLDFPPSRFTVDGPGRLRRFRVLRRTRRSWRP